MATPVLETHSTSPRDLFDYPRDRLYLDSATFGLPPKATIRALRNALDGWQSGSARWAEDWDREGETCRELLASMIGAGARDVSLQPAVSVASGVVATAIPDGGEVLLAEGDFTSVTYPFLTAAETGRIRWRAAPLERLAESVTAATAMVAVSVVHSSDGRLADLEAIRQACDTHDARLYVDASQSLGMLPLDVLAPRVDYMAVAGYKWLCCPRGTAWFYVHPDLHHEPWPVTASWRGGDDPYGRFYGVELGLADDAARFDVGLAWHPWVGARHSLETLAPIDPSTRFRIGHDAACRFASKLDLPDPPAGIVPVKVRSTEAALQVLEAEGIRVSGRAGKLRLAFHLYNTADEAEQAATVVRPFRV
ncbi:MAG: aminotransferase class V-fold PLP-dependent enzyme [Thermoanaerobaculia bacterium]|nr:aminotransferase class V-fold PLP-dependent enzyme [Thermoanaerobaculia bacterium]